MKMRRALVAALCALAGMGSFPASAQVGGDFYRGKTISLIIGFGEGGGYDLSARLVGQYLPKFLPGNPTIVPRNMPGASSVRAVEYFQNVAPRDGTALGFFISTITLDRATDHTLKYEPQSFNWLGRVDNAVTFGVVWRTAPVQSVVQAKKEKLILAAIGPAGTAATVPWALDRLIGTQLAVVTGYDSSATMGLAMERGETQGIGSTSWDYLLTKPDWFAEKKISILYTLGLARDARAPDAPTIVELVDSDRDKKVMTLLASTSTIGRALAAPPGLPPERVAILRQAFDAMVKDPAFVADAKRRQLGVDPLPGSAVQGIVEEVMDMPADIVDTMKAVTQPLR
jgi:tripartite-type tricarboxylate transporter receptor subunit TctC